MRTILNLLMALWLTAAAVARGEIRSEFAMDSDPELKAPEPIIVFPIKHLPLWFKALDRPEVDMQRRAAEAIAEAHLVGTPGLGEAQPALIKILSAETSHPTVRLAAARALIALEARDAAGILFETSQRHGTDLRQVIEPALAKWKHAPIREVWQQRLSNPETRHRDLMLAIDGARIVSDVSVVPTLLKITHDPLRPFAVRLASARSAAQLQHTGLEADAERLIKSASASIPNRQCAVSLLDQHRSEAAQAILLRLANDEEPSVMSAALSVLNATDPQLVLPFVEQALRNRDANVRLQAVAAYVALPTPERVTALASLLDDPHSGVRGHVREVLFRLASTAELDAPIRRATTDVLAGDSWRGQEQAALLLAALDHKPAAARLAQLLDSLRGEVMVAAAWGLRKLAVPETLPAILEKVRQQTELRLKVKSVSVADDGAVAHLCEALGLMKYAPADPLLRQYVPKVLDLGELSRSGAIWGLGHLHAGRTDESLAQLMTGRLTESAAAIPGEWTRVRVACAISLARMQAKSQVEPMRKYIGPKVGLDQTSLAIRWSVRELTGETLPGADRPLVPAKANWFLEPLD